MAQVFKQFNQSWHKSGAEQFDFFILYDEEIAEESVAALERALINEGHSVKINNDNKKIRIPQTRVCILYVTQDILLKRKISSALKRAVRSCENVMLLHETDEDSGAIIKRRSRKAVDLAKMLNMDERKLEYFPISRSMPFRKNISFAKYAAREIIKSCGLKKKRFSRSRKDIKFAEYKSGSRAWLISEVEQFILDDRNQVLIIVGQNDSGKSVACAALTEKLSCRTVHYFFEETDSRSRDMRMCIAHLATQLSKTVPSFQRVIYRDSDPSVLDSYTHLIANPAWLAKDQTQTIAIIIDGLNECSSTHAEAFMHAIQSRKLPPWVKVVITGLNEILQFDIGGLKAIDLNNHEGNLRDMTEFVSRSFRSHILVTDEECARFTREAVEASSGSFFYISFVENLLKQKKEMTLENFELPEDVSSIYKLMLVRLKLDSKKKLPLRMILALILAARMPIPVKIVQSICNIKLTDLETQLAASYLFYIGEGKVQFRNRQLKDWITNPANGEYFVNERDGHYLIAEWCSSFFEGSNEHCVIDSDSEGNETDSDGTLEQFAFQNMIYHLCQSNQPSKVFRYVTDFHWLLRSVELDPMALIHDLDEFYLQNESEEDIAVHRVKSALRFASLALTRDFRELASQILGRIPSNIPACQSLLATAYKYSPGEEWWRPLQPSLMHSDESIERELYHRGEINACAVSQDSRYIASGGVDPRICLWDGTSFQLLKLLSGHSESINALAFSPDCRRIASASNDTTVRIWDSITGSCMAVLEKHLTGVLDLSFSFSKNFLVSVEHLSARVWSCSDNLCLYTERKQDSGLSCVECCETNTDIYAIGYENGHIHIKKFGEIESEPIILSNGHKRCVTCLVFVSNEKNVVASGSFDRNICIWNFVKGTLLRKFVAHNGKISSLSIAGGALFSCSIECKSIKAWAIQDGNLKRAVQIADRGISSCALIPGKANYIVAGNTDGTLQILRTKGFDSKDSSPVHHNDWITASAICPVTNDIATGSWDGSIKVWSSETGEIQRTLFPEGYDAQPFIYSLDGLYLLSRIGAWDAETGERAVYGEIPKENRQLVPTATAMCGQEIPGFETIMETPNHGVSFTADCPDQIARRLLPIENKTTGNRLGIMCSGNKVHLLELMS